MDAPAHHPFVYDTVAPARHQWLTGWWPRGNEWLLLVGYALGFWFTHSISALWGGPGFFSLWFPPAGLRFALLWRFGPRLTIAVTATELMVQFITGVLDFASPDWRTMAISIARPALAYGVAIAFVRWLTERRRTRLSTHPIPVSLASVVAPLTAVLFALPWSLLRPDFTHVSSIREIVSSLTVFAIGDLLGVLLLAPPLLFLADVVSEGKLPPMRKPRLSHFIESLGVLAVAVSVVVLLSRLQLGSPATPVMLAAAWIGLRFGRLAAWATIVFVALLLFPYTAQFIDVNTKLEYHMGLASVAVAGYLAASFAAAESRARLDIARRDRLLYQAERLKTLRAMSVAVIHEISQPLSTLAIEARHLKALAGSGADPDLSASADLIERKSSALSAMVRRLRRFGGRATDEPSPIPIAALIASVVELVRYEGGRAGVRMTIQHADPTVLVVGQEIELSQALVNLLRNALQAEAQGATVAIATWPGGDEVHIEIRNRRGNRADHGGMGVGELVARAILEAHGGHMNRREEVRGYHVTTVTLPVQKELK